MGSSSFPVDLVLFGMIAAFLILRLRSILGRRDGFEPNQAPNRPAGRAGAVIEGRAEPVQPPGHPVPDAASPLGQTLQRMHRVDGSFDAGHFLAGAESAFRMIVAAFAAGDRDALRPLLTADTFTGFDAAMTAREAEGHTQATEIRDIQTVAVEAATLEGTMAEITVRFVSDQIAQTFDRGGKYVAGADAVTELRDEWSFVRDLARPDPAWRLAHARAV